MTVAASPKPFLHHLYLKARSTGVCFFALAILVLLAGTSSAATIVVPPGGDLQAAIDAAQFGDTIILQAGATYQAGGAPYYAPFYLGPKSGGTGTDADFITIRSSNIALLPAGRVSPQDKANMARIEVLGVNGAFVFLGNARYWKLAGLEITNLSDGTQLHHVNTFISVGGYPGIAHSWIDRCYVHPQEDGTYTLARTASHGIVVSSPPTGANVYDTRITNSRVSGFAGTYAHDPTQLIDAIALSSNVLDTILLDNNFLSGTYQPWFPGGGDPVNPKTAVVQTSPAPTLTTATLSNVTSLSVGDYMTFPQSDANPRKNGNARITAISGNNITFTSMTRFRGAPEPPVVGSTVMWGGDVGRNYTVTHNTFDIDPVMALAALTVTGSSPKGYIEMKMGLNVYLEGNIFQGWPSAIAIQSTNQNSDTPWVTVSDFTFRNNWVRDFGLTFVINMGNTAGTDWDINRMGENLVIENNLFTQDTVAGESKMILAVNLGPNASIRHNTWITRTNYDGQAVSVVPGGGATGLTTIKDNIWLNSRYGWGCNGGLPVCFPDLVEAKNAITNNLGGSITDADIQSIWRNSYVGSSSSNPIVFTGSNPNVLLDWKLTAGSPYRAGGARQASDGTDVGVDFVRIAAALAGGSEPPPPTPTPTPAASPTPTPVPTPTPIASPTPTPVPTPTPIASPTPTPLPTPTASPTPFPTPMASPTPTPTPYPTPVGPASARFVKVDSTTQGNWRDVYGADGYQTINDSTNYPAYAQVSAVGQDAYTWAPSTSEVRGLQRASVSGRRAAAWYNNSFTIDMNLMDGGTHRLALYCLDWDNQERIQRVDVLDASTNNLLDSRTISSFNNGKYLIWDVKGRVKIYVKQVVGSNAVVSGLFLESIVNPVDNAQNFVRQQYLDFLGREPDTAGWDYWSQLITRCPVGDVACVMANRINVSAAFFVEQEFQQTGSFVYRFYKSSLGRQPGYAEFAYDRAQVVSSDTLEANKQSFANAWVTRAEFLQRYNTNLSGPQFIDALLQTVQQNSGVDLSSARAALLADWNVNGSRARIVRLVADNPSFTQAEYNPAFVLMQYFGYLRRDADSGGYSFWLNVLNNRDPNNHRGMVCAFITSAEYQLRFGQYVTHTDAECGQ